MSNTPNWAVGKSTDEIQAGMEARFASGNAYNITIPWDQMRHEALVEAITGLMDDPDGKGPGYFPGREASTILDMCCGAGGTVAFIPEHAHPRFTGVEIAPTAVKQAQAAYPKATFICSPAERYTPSRAFDLVNCIEAIEHWPDVHTPGILASIKRAMGPDSRLVMSTPNRDSLHIRIGEKLGLEMPKCCVDHIHEYGYDELLQTMYNAGFEVCQSKGVFCMPYWALESEFRNHIRHLTDKDTEVLTWMYEIGKAMPPKYAFGQAHSFRLAQ